jgi:hypothetical protein
MRKVLLSCCQQQMDWRIDRSPSHPAPHVVAHAANGIHHEPLPACLVAPLLCRRAVIELPQMIRPSHATPLFPPANGSSSHHSPTQGTHLRTTINTTISDPDLNSEQQGALHTQQQSHARSEDQGAPTRATLHNSGPASFIQVGYMWWDTHGSKHLTSMYLIGTPCSWLCRSRHAIHALVMTHVLVLLFQCTHMGLWLAHCHLYRASWDAQAPESAVKMTAPASQGNHS